ncbi:GntR family transcriptional regulator [Pseudonocardia bannensis]|uniref:GntR family transcriptional regulator n=1 Tax=Pseudonocardia bannensis TaxID=630973 RepID=A0A848DKT5_9PSEU|nr:GntR family transcriptional regulator [Pseudonocardia bannensis]NMH93136.1 GntR family transcriptional regulator [Pseudonocardia bannensis]
MALRPISGETLADAAYRRISEAMLTGGLEPGARLVMDTLAAQLEISRTPVRDALHRLEREGLIEPAGRRGFVVRRLGPAEIHHLYEIRMAVEVFAAGRVAELGSEAVSHVADAIRKAEVMGLSEPAEAFAANRLVHRAVVEATGNPLLVDLFDGIWTRATALQVYSGYFQRELVHRPIRELHQPMLEALAAGPERAVEVMRHHIQEGLEATLE